MALEGVRVGNLWDLIQAYLDDTGGTSAAALSRRIGSKPQTLSSWKTRGIRELPSVDTLRNLADAIEVPYDIVLRAAEADAGYRDDEDKDLSAALEAYGVRGRAATRLRKHVAKDRTNPRTRRRGAV